MKPQKGTPQLQELYIDPDNAKMILQKLDSLTMSLFCETDFFLGGTSFNMAREKVYGLFLREMRLVKYQGQIEKNGEFG